jgi:hypothetical protein
MFFSLNFYLKLLVLKYEGWIVFAKKNLIVKFLLELELALELELELSLEQ